jgi:hypothetical protein
VAAMVCADNARRVYRLDRDRRPGSTG